MDTLLYARWYARRGIPVFPCYTIEDGACSCGNPSCSSPGKHPIGKLVPHGVLEATTDVKALEQWWALYPDSNIGIATGFRSGIAVVDIDPGKGGEDSWQNLESLFEPITNTWWIETGSGGYHIYFAADDDSIRNSASLIGPGIDVRGEGGYVIAPPSLHISGGSYQWSAELNHKTIEHPAPMPEWLYKRVTGGRKSASGQPLTNPLPERITEGGRNVWMTSVAGTMRRRGMSRQAIEAALQIENRLRCAPPLDSREVERIAASVDRYPAAANMTLNGTRVSA